MSCLLAFWASSIVVSYLQRRSATFDGRISNFQKCKNWPSSKWGQKPEQCFFSIDARRPKSWLCMMRVCDIGDFPALRCQTKNVFWTCTRVLYIKHKSCTNQIKQKMQKLVARWSRNHILVFCLWSQRNLAGHCFIGRATDLSVVGTG